MNYNIISILTPETVEEIISAGGSGSWKLDKNRAKSCKFAVLCKGPGSNVATASDFGFMVGKIRDIVPSTTVEGRWVIRFSEYALQDFGRQWEGGTNPIHYTEAEYYNETECYGKIEFDKIKFTPMPTTNTDADTSSVSLPLTLAAAKNGLALTFGVPASAVEIVIRG